MNIDLVKIGKYIAKLRALEKISQKELASYLSVTRAAISKWENGKGLPDVTLLVKLAEYFDVSVDLILAGGEVNNDSNKITLGLVNIINRRGKKIIFLRNILILSLFLLIVLSLGIYFISNYNSIKVFRVNSLDSHVLSNKGILVLTKDNSYLRLGDITSEQEKVKKVRLYYLDKNDNKRIVFEDIDSDILITSKFGYDEYFSYDDLELIKNNLYLEIVYDDSLEKIKLNLEEDFSNKRFFFFRKNKVGLERGSDDYLKNLTLFSKKTILKIKEFGKYEDDKYIYNFVAAGRNISISYDLGIIELMIKEDESLKKWVYYTNTEKDIAYFDIGNNQNDLRFNLDKKLSSKERKVKEEFFGIIEKYLW